MPLNQIKSYNSLLELTHLTPKARIKSLRMIFNRDISEDSSNFKFNNKQITPTPDLDGTDKMDLLFNHLTTEVVNQKTKKREYDRYRSERLHWIKHHINKRENKILIFSTKEKRSYRTYIYDTEEKYVIVLEPLRNNNGYYLLTAYYVRGKNDKRNKFVKMYS